jgi:hypothetical protein
MTGLRSAKAIHSSQYQIPIKLNQQPPSGNLQHEENNSLIAPSTCCITNTGSHARRVFFENAISFS